MTSLNGVRKWRLTAKETSIVNCEVLDEKYCIAGSRNFCRHYYKSWWLKLTDWLFAFAFCKI